MIEVFLGLKKEKLIFLSEGEFFVVGMNDYINFSYMPSIISLNTVLSFLIKYA